MSITKRALKASKHQFVYSFLGKGIGFIFGILTARILFPEDYGVLAIAIVFSSFFTIFSNFGFQSYILQEDVEEKDSIHTTFFLVFTFSAIIAGLLYFSSNWINAYYKLEKLDLILKIYAVNILLNGLSSVPLSNLKKHLDFKSTGRADFLYLVSSNIGRLFFAFMGLGALCFPIGDFIGHFFKVLYSFRVARFVPSFQLINLTKLKQILSFGSFTSITSIGAYFANQTDKFLISKYFSVKSVGQYNFGYQQASIFYTFVQVSQTSLLLSFFAKFKNDIKEARRLFVKMNGLLIFVSIPFYSFCYLEAENILFSVFSEKWVSSIIFFRIFLIDFFIRSLIAGITGLQISFGLAKAAAKTKIINSIIFVLCLLTATLFNDITYYALFYLLGSILAAMHNFRVNGKLIQLSIMEQFRNIFPTILISFLSIGSYLAIFNIFIKLDLGFISLSINFVLFALIYTVMNLAFNKRQINILKSTVLKVIK